jgi:hypothetical protein
VEYKGHSDLQVGKALASMRWHASTITGMSAFQVLFGRKPFLPSYLNLPNDLKNLSIRAEDEIEIDQKLFNVDLILILGNLLLVIRMGRFNVRTPL